MKIVATILGVIAAFIGIIWFAIQSIIGTLAEPVDAFFSAWSTGNPSVSGQLLSEDFKRNTPFDALQSFMRQQRLDQVIETSWNNSKIENQVGTLSGTLTRRDGTVTPATVTLLKVAEQWKIQFINIGAPAQPRPVAQHNPVIASQQTNQGQYNAEQAWTRSSDANPQEAASLPLPAGLSIKATEP